jgi:hypothetical protein
MKEGPELLQLFCKHYKLKMQYDQGNILLFPDVNDASYTEAKDRLINTSLSNVVISSEFLPHALRNLLKPYGLSFSLMQPEQEDKSKPNPIMLNNYRIGMFKRENTNLHKVLLELANMNNFNLWVCPNRITFIPKSEKLVTVIQSSRLKK